MAAIRLWAKSVFAISMLASALVLLVPKSMAKQSRFAAEMLILLAVLTPLVGFFVRGDVVPASTNLSGESGAERFALDRFVASEIAARVGDMVRAAGFSAGEVAVETSGSGYQVAGIKLALTGESPTASELAALKATLSAYLSVPGENIFITVSP